MLSKKTALEYNEVYHRKAELGRSIEERLADILRVLSKFFRDTLSRDWMYDTATLDDVFHSIEVYPDAKRRHKNRTYVFLNEYYGGLPKEFLWMNDDRIMRIIKRDMMSNEKLTALVRRATSKLTAEEFYILEKRNAYL